MCDSMDCSRGIRNRSKRAKTVASAPHRATCTKLADGRKSKYKSLKQKQNMVTLLFLLNAMYLCETMPKPRYVSIVYSIPD